MPFSVLAFWGFLPELPTPESWLQWARGTHAVSCSEAVLTLTHMPAATAQAERHGAHGFTGCVYGRSAGERR